MFLLVIGAGGCGSPSGPQGKKVSMEILPHAIRFRYILLWYRAMLCSSSWLNKILKYRHTAFLLLACC